MQTLMIQVSSPLSSDEIVSETRDHAHSLQLTGDEEEQALCERVRHGDEQAREALFSYLEKRYWRYARRSMWAEALETADLVQEALLVALTKLPQALKRSNALPYLTKVGYEAIRAYCYEYQGIVKRQMQTRVASFLVVSLDQPLRQGHDGKTTTLAE